MKRIVFALLFAYTVSATAWGGGGMTGGATEITQLMNNSELLRQVTQLAEQINNQITMINDMIYNTKAMANQLFPDVTLLYSNIKSVMDNTMGIAHTLANYGEEIKRRFKSYKDLGSSLSNAKDFTKEYRDIVETRMETTRTVMEGLGVMAEEFENDGKILQKLQEKAASATGRNEIAQGANQLLSFLGQELMRLRELQMMQLNSAASALEAERAARELGERQEEAASQTPERDHDVGVFKKSPFDF